LNRQQWKLAILDSLQHEGRIAGLSGKSRFDELLTKAHAVVDAGEAGELVEAIMLAGAEGSTEPAEWWLGLLLFLDGYNFQLSTSLRMRVISFAESECCVDPIARGYLLRNVADLGLPLSWDRLENQAFYSKLLDTQPLLLADALVRCGENDRAAAALEKAKAMPSIQGYHFSEMYEVWRDAGLEIPQSQSAYNTDLVKNFGVVTYQMGVAA
jgi:hypothetical protein